MVSSNTKSSHSEQKTDPDFVSVQNVCPVSFRWFVMWPSDQHPANEQCRQTNGRESAWSHVSQVGEDTFLRFAGCRESCVLRACQATTVLNLFMIPAFAGGSAKAAMICEHLSISFSEVSEEIDGSSPGCASLEKVDSSPKRAVCVLSGDADMAKTSK